MYLIILFREFRPVGYTYAIYIQYWKFQTETLVHKFIFLI